MSEALDEQWACLSCFSKFRVGQLRTGGGVDPRSPGNYYGLNCPQSRSMNVHPADGKTYKLK